MDMDETGERVVIVGKTGANGDVQHEDRSAKGLSGIEELLPKSLGSSPFPGTINGNAISKPGSTPDRAPASGSQSPETTAKGYGLRRWRRVKRNVSKEDGSSSDTSRILKRGLSISESAKLSKENPPKISQEDDKFSASVDSKTQESVSSVHSPDLELLETVAGFSVGINSEDSDERSNREGSRHEKERDRVRNLRGKSSGQRRKGASLETSKKIRGDQAMKPEKEDSHSSVESDLRSSNAVYEHFTGAKSNGTQSEVSVNYYGTLGHGKAEEVEETSRDDLQEDASRKDDVEEREIQTCHEHDEDPFSEPLNLLQAAQETLEREIQNLGEISRDLSSRPKEESRKEIQEKEMEELEALFRKRVEGEVNSLILSSAVREERRRGEREKVVVLERQLEQVAESCRGLERIEEVLKLQNGVCKFSLYWLAQLVLLLLAMAAVAAQIFFSPGSGGGDVPT